MRTAAATGPMADPASNSASDPADGSGAGDAPPALTVRQTDHADPLSDCVRAALRTYLANMGGHEVSGLYRLVLDQVEQPMLETVLEYTRGNQSVAAQMLGMSRSTLRKKLKGASES